MLLRLAMVPVKLFLLAVRTMLGKQVGILFCGKIHLHQHVQLMYIIRPAHRRLGNSS
jgi:hypothetical protein